MHITIVCDEFTLEDVKALGRYLRDRYKDSPRKIGVLVAAGQIPAAEAAAALQTIFGKDPYWTQILPFKRGNGNK